MQSLNTMKRVAMEVIDLTSGQPGILKGQCEVSTCMSYDSTRGQRYVYVTSHSHNTHNPHLKRRRMAGRRRRAKERPADRAEDRPNDRDRQQVANEFANAVLSDLLHTDVNALHHMINTQRTHIIVSDTSRFTDLSDTIKGAVRMNIRNSCPHASDELIALIFTKVAHQCSIGPDYMIGSNAIAPLPTIQRMQDDIGALQQSVAELERNLEGMRNDMQRNLEDMRNDMQRNLEDMRNDMQRNLEDMRNDMQRNMEEILRKLP